MNNMRIKGDEMSTITDNQRAAITVYLDTHPLSVGVGTAESACSIAAINLALTGELTDRIPDCMSEVVGYWIIGIQDAMPDALRNSAEWKRLLPLAAGTGRAHEAEHLAILMDWMWCTVLPIVQPTADAEGFGTEWKAMTEGKTEALADAARFAAVAARYADATLYAARAAYAAYAARDTAGAWETFDPCAVLARLIKETK